MADHSPRVHSQFLVSDRPNGLRHCRKRLAHALAKPKRSRVPNAKRTHMNGDTASAGRILGAARDLRSLRCWNNTAPTAWVPLISGPDASVTDLTSDRTSRAVGDSHGQSVWASEPARVMLPSRSSSP